MRIKIFILFLILINVFCQNIFGQELFCKIQISTDQITSTNTGSALDPNLITELQSVITQFMNTKKWSNDRFKEQEKIACNMVINITSVPELGTFKCNAQMQVSRPIYGSNYESLLLNYVDANFDFRYVTGQQMDYSESSFSSNLVSLLAFYANLFIGLDYDSYSKMGGSPYFEKALQIVNYSQDGGGTGWKAFENQTNRYWLLENLNSPQMQQMREGSYKYHRLGLDMMTKNAVDARSKIFESIQAVKKVNDVKPATILIRTFFNSKDNELVSVFSEGNPDEKQKIYDLLRVMDPTNSQKYEKIIK